MTTIPWRRQRQAAWGHVNYTSKIPCAAGQYYITQHFTGFDVIFVLDPVQVGTAATAREAQALAQRHYDEMQP